MCFFLYFSPAKINVQATYGYAFIFIHFGLSPMVWSSGVARGGPSNLSWREPRPFEAIPGGGSKTAPYGAVCSPPPGVAPRG